MSRFKKLAASGWKSVLYTIGVLLLTQGAKGIESGDYVLGGTMAVIGFILFLIANY